MSILIDKVRVYNYRSIEKCEVELSPVTLLIGANNTGKTSFLRALNLALGVGARRISREDFFIKKNDASDAEKEIMVDVRIIPVNSENAKIDNFDDAWREKQFGELISIDESDKEFLAFRTKVNYDVLKGDYSIKRYKIKEWSDSADWQLQRHTEELKQFFDAFPLFFIDAQRDIIQDLRDRNSYFGRLVSKIKIDNALIKDIEERIKAINAGIVANSEELGFLKQELEKIRGTIGSDSAIEISPVNKKMRDINRSININLQDSDSESFPLDYHGMGTRSWASLLTFGAFISWQYKKSESDKSPYHTLLALEEPEAHLHPHAQRTLYAQLSVMNGQKIISSHSPFIAAQCELSELRHFQKMDGSTLISKIDLAGLSEEEKRKLRREVLDSRGELFFSCGVVLFEGETEEQALPIFASKYWNKHHYELGISFIGVGGDGNYAPFLRMLKSFDIPWFIFSDGESVSISRVEEALKKVGYPALNKMTNVIVIPDNDNYEKYLLKEGYRTEILKSIILFEKDNGVIKNARHEQAKKAELDGKSDDEILTKINNWKTKLSPYVAKEICDRNDAKKIPKVIAKLFKEMNKTIFAVKKP